MAFTYDQVTAITHDLIKDELTDGVFTSDRVLSRFRKMQDVEDGGNKVLCPLMSVDDTGSTGSFYASRDDLSLDEYDGLTASQHDWKYVYESVVIYKPDIALNGGDAGVLKLVTSKVKQAEEAMKQRLIKSILTGSATNEFVGLDSVIASSGAYGGINPADLATWVSNVDDNSGTGRALTQAILDANYDLTVESGKGGASLGLCRKQVFSKIKGLLTGFQRTTRESSLDGFGHRGAELVYNGIDYVVENQMASGTIFHVDEEHFKLHVQKDNNMRRQSISDLETKDALVERIFLYALVAASERKYHGRINDINE